MPTTSDTMFVTELGALQLRLDVDPALRTSPVEIAILDGPLDLAALHDRLERVTEAIPALRAVVRRAPFSSAPERLVADPHFALDEHLSRVRLESGDNGDLAHVVARVSMHALDRARPLWSCTLVDGLPGSTSAVLLHVHRAVAERITGDVVVLDRLFDEQTVAGQEPQPVDGRSLLRLRLDAAQHERRRVLGLARRGGQAVVSGLVDPVGAGLNVALAGMSVARVLTSVARPPQSAFENRSGRARVGLVRMPEAVATAAAAGGVSVEDVVLAVALRALGTYSNRAGRDLRQARVRITDLAPGKKLLPALFVAPIPSGPAPDALGSARASAKEGTVELARTFIEPLAGVANRVPGSLVGPLLRRIVDSADVALTFRDVPGGAQTRHLAGVPVRQTVVVDPPAGAAVHLSVLRVGDSRTVGVTIDRAAIDDPSSMLECLRQAVIDVVGVDADVVALT